MVIGPDLSDDGGERLAEIADNEGRYIVPVWAPAAIVVGSIVNFLAESAAVNAIGFAFLLIGFGSVGLKLLSMSDDEWDHLGRRPGPAEPPPGLVA